MSAVTQTVTRSTWQAGELLVDTAVVVMETPVGFVQSGRHVIYTHPHRLVQGS